MVRAEFDRFLGVMGAFYERKVRPTEHTTDLWYDKVKKIPGDALAWIENRIQAECESWPRNITATMWAMFHQWLDANPERRAPERQMPCAECGGEGELFVRKRNDAGVHIRYVFRCGACNQSRLSQEVPGARIRVLQAQGYELRDKRGNYGVEVNP